MSNLKKTKAPPREDLFTAIIFFTDKNKLPFKYRRIRGNDIRTAARFIQFLTNKFPDWWYINYYGGITGDYIRREYNPNNNKTR